jgi:phage baseplate assembly protein W
MGYVVESSSTNDILQFDTALGVKFTNESRIFTPLYTIPEQAKENFKTLLLTTPGERYMLPEYGCGLLSMIFEPADEQFALNISDTIYGAVNTWLPYITITTLDVHTAADTPSLENIVEISIEFNVQNFSTEKIKIFVDENGTIAVS